MALTPAAVPSKYRRNPDHENPGWPAGVPYIIGNEAAERFSFYGMKALLKQHLTMLYATGAVAMSQADAARAASHDYHIFLASVYAFCVLGAAISDKLLGKYLTIFSLSLIYCAGHLVLAVADDSIGGMHAGLALIAVGSGGIKPCVAANVGDQFGAKNRHLIPRVFQYFYISINGGSFLSTILTPIILATLGASWAFGVPGILMAIATLVFWAGRYKFVHIPAKPGGKLGLLDAAVTTLLFVGGLGVWLFRDSFELSYAQAGLIAAVTLPLGVALFLYRLRLAPDDGFLATLLTTAMRGARGARERLGEDALEGMRAVFRIMFIFIWVSIFWALFDQHSSTWLDQAGMMEREYFGTTLMIQQTQAANPLLVLLLIPLLLHVIFPWFERRGITITPLRRMTAGMVFAALSFVAVALVQHAIDDAAKVGEKIDWAWQLLPYVVLTLAEALVSATGLEFAYSQAPARMKSTIMSFWYLCVTFGNFLVAGVLAGLPKLSLADFFWLFAALSAAAAVGFGVVAYFYKYRDYHQN
jgi:POT family proton-dependent oligopeptide transporter